MNNKCPDRQLISVYFDGELSSPWKEKMESHVADCPLCRERLEKYRAFSAGPVPGDANIQAAQDRVWQKIEQYLDLPARPFRITGRETAFGALWQRRISIPIPAAAAIALLFIALTFVWVIKTPRTTEAPGMAFISENDFETPGIIPVSDMEDVLQYLGSRDTGDLLIIRLPESRNFVSNGEPAILRAADYSRQVTNQQTPGRRKP